MRPLTALPAPRATNAAIGHPADSEALDGSSRLEPRPYQSRVRAKAIEALLSGTRTVLIGLPTASGKMVVALLVLKSILEHAERLLGKPAGKIRIAWAALRRELLEQAWAENQRWHLVPDEVIDYVTIFQSDIVPADVLVFDEAQHEGAPLAVKLHAQMQPQITLGLTATPYRADGVGLPFQKTISDCGIRLLMADGHLCPFEHYTVPAWTIDTVTKALATQPAHWGQSIVFMPTIADCDEVSYRLRAFGLQALTVAGGRRNQEALRAFRSGELQILVSAMLLVEGFNVPGLTSVFVRDGTRGPTTQMAGRALRLHAGKTIARIVQSAQTRYAFTRSAEPTRRFVLDQGVWRDVCTSPVIEAIQSEMFERIRAQDVVLPERVLRPPQGRRRLSRRGDRHQFFNP